MAFGCQDPPLLTDDRIRKAFRASHRNGKPMPCPFCSLPPDRIVLSSADAIALRDAYPISPGHTLIVPRRHVGSFFEATAQERADLLALLDEAKGELDARFAPAAFNIGINDGPAAGQTVPHLHIHLIPRYVGDRIDPRGGVRWIIPDKADYWSTRDIDKP
jgi:diadenosine tetraphosphate (Ap4A) HIT family hydrolase